VRWGFDFDKEIAATMFVLLLALIGLFLLFLGMLGVAFYAEHYKRRLPR
jgi:multisubunit Na+/H+ antiporter MnhG subunit